MPTIEQARNWYPVDDLVHGLDHVLRVRLLALHIARCENADEQIVEAAALLHDAQDLDHIGTHEATQRSNHHQRSAELAAEVLRHEGWAKPRITAVQQCILAHRFRGGHLAPATLEARVLFDADKLDAIGSVGAARAIAFALRAGMPIYAHTSDRFLQTGETEPGELHSAYHEYIFKLSKITDLLYTPTARKIAQTRQSRMAAFFDGLRDEIESFI